MVFQFTSHQAPSSEALPRKSEIQSSANVTLKKKKKKLEFIYRHAIHTLPFFHHSESPQIVELCTLFRTEMLGRDLFHSAISQPNFTRQKVKQARKTAIHAVPWHRDRTREALTLWITTLCALASRQIPNPCFNTSVKFLSHPNLLFQVATRQQYMKLEEGTTRR